MFNPSIQEELMTNFRLAQIFLFIILQVSLAGILQAADLYWISLMNENVIGESASIMQIDETGKVTIASKVVVSSPQLENIGCDSSTAIAQGKAGKINMWIACESDIMRAVVTKSNLSATISKTTLTTTDDDAIQASPGLLAIETGNSVLKAFGVLQNGLPDGTTFRLSPRTDGGNDEGGISSDGKVAYSVDFDPDVERLYLQPLNNNHRPDGDPMVVASSPDIDSVDVTNPLANGKRFVSFYDDSVDTIFVQVVNAELNKLGPRKVIAFAGDIDEDQTSAIDPLGRFVLFVLRDSCPDDQLFFQGLDSAGNPTGPAKAIIDCEDGDGNIEGLNILKE